MRTPNTARARRPNKIKRPNILVTIDLAVLEDVICYIDHKAAQDECWVYGDFYNKIKDAIEDTRRTYLKSKDIG